MTGVGPPPGPGAAGVDADPLAAFLKLAQQEGALEGENLEAFVTGLRERADQVIAERLGRAETKLRVLETENEWHKDTRTGLEGAMATLEGEKLWLRETIGTLEGEKAWLRETIGTLEGEKAWLRETIGALEGETAWLRETIGTLEGETAWLRKTTGALEGEKASLREAIGTLEGETAWLRESLGNLEEENAWLRETMGTLEAENARMRETIGALEAEAILRRRAIEAAGDEREKASAAHESLLNHHRELMARLAGQLGEIASLSPLRAREVRRRLLGLADLLRADTR